MMSLKQLFLELVLVGFAALTGYCVYTYGYIGTVRAGIASGPALLFSADVVIALTMIAVWMGEDAERRRISAIPYLLLTIAFGSAGPLLYLIRRSYSRRPQTDSAVRASTA